MTNEITLFDNPATRCPVVLLLDRSESMNEIIADAGAETGNTYFADGQNWIEVEGGTTRMDKLNQGLHTFFQTIADDEVAKFSVEVKILSFGDSVKHESDFVSFANINSYSPGNIIPQGNTALGSALDEGVKILHKRKQFYRKNGISYYQPWMVLMTDGRPTDAWKIAAENAKRLAGNKKLNFFGVGVGQDFDFDCLSQILPAHRPPLELDETKFKEFFLWLSASLCQASRSNQGDQVSLPPVDGWAVLTA